MLWPRRRVYGGGKRRKRRREGGREGGVSPIYSRRAGFPPPMLPKSRPAPTKMLYPRRWARPVPQYAPSPEQHANRTMASGRCYWPCGIIWGGQRITAGFPLRSMNFVRCCAQRPARKINFGTGFIFNDGKQVQCGRYRESVQTFADRYVVNISNNAWI